MIASSRRFPFVTRRLQRVGELPSSLTLSLKINEGNCDAHGTNNEEKSENDDRGDHTATYRSFHFRRGQSRHGFYGESNEKDRIGEMLVSFCILEQPISSMPSGHE